MSEESRAGTRRDANREVGNAVDDSRPRREKEKEFMHDVFQLSRLGR
jgi:hypothetical protein